jgi:ubiquitin-conjugating enzyme E2 A
MTSKCVKRLTNELNDLLKNPVEGFILTEYENIMIWKGFIEGPSDTPFEKGKFNIQFTFDDDYPFKPPSVKFLQTIFHPNIYRDGKICVDILETQNWAPSTNVKTIALSLRSLFMDPNPNSPANRDAAKLFMENKKLYEEKVKNEIESNIKNIK